MDEFLKQYASINKPTHFISHHAYTPTRYNSAYNTLKIQPPKPVPITTRHEDDGDEYYLLYDINCMRHYHHYTYTVDQCGNLAIYAGDPSLIKISPWPLKDIQILNNIAYMGGKEGVLYTFDLIKTAIVNVS